MSDTDRTSFTEPGAYLAPVNRKVESWDKWTCRLVWTLKETSHLLMGLEPPTERTWSKVPTPEWSAAKVYEHLKVSYGHPRAPHPLTAQPSATGYIEDKKILVSDAIQWARDVGVPLPDELVSKYPQSKKSEAPPIETKAPGPKLEFLGRSGLTAAFKSVKGIDWKRATSDANRNGLAVVDRKLVSRREGYHYDPDGAAAWAIIKYPRLKRKVALAMVSLIQEQSGAISSGSKFAKKEAYWQDVADE